MAHRYRLYPTSEQAAVMSRHCADARFVWNLALEQANLYRPHWGPTPNWVQRMRQLTEARQGTWLGDGSSSVQRQALRDFDQAMRNWWSGSHRRPTWRRKGVHEGFCVRDVAVRKLNRKWAEVTVPKAGRARFRLSRPMPVEHGMGRVTLDQQGRWHVSFSAPQGPVQRSPTGAAVGIDRGIAVTVATSDGDVLHIPVPSKAERQRRVRLQRRMARQVKGSNRRARTKLAVAKLTGKWADRRKDWAEKTSTWLVRNYDVVVFEDLHVRQMMRSAKGTVKEPGHNVRAKAGLNRSIAEAGWTLIERRTADKAAASEGCQVIHVPAPGTSQTCHQCGHRDPANRASQFALCCVACGHEAHADINAARNIRAAGLAVLARGGVGVAQASEPRTSRKERRCAA